MDALDTRWLATELENVNDDVAGWSDGLKESFDSLFPEELPDSEARQEPKES